jgi:hypothetical protein
MNIGQTYLITTDNWFLAPDGEQYSAAFGTVHSVVDSAAVLGIRPNRNSSNWYVAIGDMVIAGCQIHYAIRSDTFSPEPSTAEVDHNGMRHKSMNATTRIYDADESGLIPAGTA